MLTGVQEHHDGDIYVRNGRAIYKDTRANFEADFGRALEPLPDGATQRVYEPGKRHAFADGASVLGGGDMPWPFGDAAVAACDALLAKQHARRNPPPTLAQLKARKTMELSVACAWTIQGGFKSSALGSERSYPSNPTDQRNLADSVMLAIADAGLTPEWSAPFWNCLDGDGGLWAFTPHSAAQIKQVGADCRVHIVAAQLRLAALSAEVAEAETPEAVAAIAWEVP